MTPPPRSVAWFPCTVDACTSTLDPSIIPSPAPIGAELYDTLVPYTMVPTLESKAMPPPALLALFRTTWLIDNKSKHRPQK